MAMKLSDMYWLKIKRMKYLKDDRNIYYNYDMSDSFMAMDVTNSVLKENDSASSATASSQLQHGYATRNKRRHQQNRDDESLPPSTSANEVFSSLKPLYDGPLPISMAKKKDLVNLCRKGVIPDEYHGWFESLPTEANQWTACLRQPYLTQMGANQSEQPAGKGDLVARIKEKLASVDQAKARELGGVFLFNIIKGTTVYSWTLDLNTVTVYEGEPEEDPDTTFTLSEHYFKQLVQGREDARVIMQTGRCSVTGDIMRAMKLEPYIKLE